MRADFAPQPEAGLDADGHGQPELFPLRLDVHFIGLDLPAVAWLLDQMLMDLLRMCAAFLLPVANGSLIQLEGPDNGDNRTPEGQQGDHDRDQIGGVSETIKSRAGTGAESLLAWWRM
ncbi:MAG: hypothetical protein ACKV2V_15925 [Blastocatellia bacterium]